MVCLITERILLIRPQCEEADSSLTEKVLLRTFQCRRHRLGGGEGVDLGERTFSRIADRLDPETVAAQFTQTLDLKRVTRSSIDRNKPEAKNLLLD